MRVPLVFTLTHSVDDTNTTLYPGIDSNDQVILTSEELDDSEVFSVDRVQSMDDVNDKLETTFWLDGVPAGSWTVRVTPGRVIVHNQYSKGMFGGVKIKRGRACAGHVNFKCLMGVGALWFHGDPALALYVQRKDRTRSMVVISTPNEELMRDMLASVHNRLGAWLDANDRRLTPEGMTEESFFARNEAWRLLPGAAWGKKGKAYSVEVPYELLTLVPDSRR